MRITNRDVIDVMTSINALSKEKLPIKFSWRMETARRTLLPFYEAAVGAVDKIKMSRALRDPEGKFVLASDEKGNKLPGTLTFDAKEVPEVNKEIEALLNEEVDVENVTIKISDFPDTLEVSPESIRGLNTVIRE